METQRLLLVLAFTVLRLLTWQAWQRDYGLPPAPPPVPQGAPGQTTEPVADGADDLPALREEDTATLLPTPESRRGEQVHVRTDVLDVTIDTLGGNITRLALPLYPRRVDRPDESFVLLDADADVRFLLQGGVISRGAAPTHEALYRAERNDYTLSEDALEVRLRWRDAQGGLEVDKVYTFRRDSYLVELHYELRNPGTQPWSGRVYAQLQRGEPSGGWQPIISYTGAALSTPEDRYQKISFDDIAERKLETEVTGGWIAFLQHYFVTALLPASASEPYRYYTLAPAGERYIVGSLSPALQLAPGAEARTGHRLFLGPKLQQRLEQTAPGLELTVDYGWLWFISKFLFIVLAFLQQLTDNWGVSIILLTVLIKLVFYRLSALSYRSMAAMRRLQPRLEILRERFGDDRARLQQAVMQLYREEKVNPFSGCLPILVQIPVFIALYWVLLESVELRQADFMLWINDLSVRDPLFVLPLLMGISMFIQQKLSPQPPDPVQRRVFAILPIVFTVFFAFSPSGLVLYWLVNNILSILQQWYITRSLEQSAES